MCDVYIMTTLERIPIAHDVVVFALCVAALVTPFGTNLGPGFLSQLGKSTTLHANSTIELHDYAFHGGSGTTVEYVATVLCFYLVATCLTLYTDVKGSTWMDTDTAHGVRYGLAAVLLISLLDVVAGNYMQGSVAYTLVLAAVVLGSSRQWVRPKEKTRSLLDVTHEQAIHRHHLILTLGVLIGACVSPYGHDNNEMVQLFSADTHGKLHDVRTMAIILVVLYVIIIGVEVVNKAVFKNYWPRLFSILVRFGLFLGIAVQSRSHSQSKTEVMVESQGNFWMAIAFFLCFSELVVAVLEAMKTGGVARVFPGTGKTSESTSVGTEGSLLPRTSGFRPAEVGEIKF